MCKKWLVLIIYINIDFLFECRLDVEVFEMGNLE